MKKPRSDSKLDSLPESRAMELRDGLLGGWRYEDAMSWLITECGISSSMAALSAFYKRHCSPLVRERRQLAALKAETIGDLAGSTDWNAATMELVKQVSFEMMSGEKIDPETAEKFIKLILKAESQETDRRKLSLLEDKAKQVDDAKGVLEKKLSQEEQTRRLREILK